MKQYPRLAIVLTLTACSAEGPQADARNGDPGLDEGAQAGVHAESDELSPHLGPLEESLERWQREFAGSFGEPLPEYAAKCDIATGIHVPDFACSNGAVVPTTHLANGMCDRPNRLNRECDPGSRFQVVAETADAVAVAHCRKRGLSGNDFSDIAVIQYNKVNGAACFYQALGVMDGDFKAPSLGTSLSSQATTPNPAAAPWLSSSATEAIGCGGCHDNGAFIRSPYITQMSNMPGAGDFSYNKTNPVSFIGTDFENWETHSVKVAGNTCNDCHRLGVSTIYSGVGTALLFGIRATAQSEVAKNPHSAASPIWMTPGQITFSQRNSDQAKLMKDCATAWLNGAALPGGCSIEALTSPWAGLTPAVVAHAARPPTLL